MAQVGFRPQKSDGAGNLIMAASSRGKIARIKRHDHRAFGMSANGKRPSEWNWAREARNGPQAGLRSCEGTNGQAGICSSNSLPVTFHKVVAANFTKNDGGRPPAFQLGQKKSFQKIGHEIISEPPQARPRRIVTLGELN